MKNLNLDALGVQEMKAVEMKKTDGGIWQFVILALVGGAIYDVVMNPSDTADAFAEGFNNTNRHYNSQLFFYN